ncbi:hypothetical protein pb186bvf_014285 [Paramecium bursaria]
MIQLFYLFLLIFENNINSVYSFKIINIIFPFKIFSGKYKVQKGYQEISNKVRRSPVLTFKKKRKVQRQLELKNPLTHGCANHNLIHIGIYHQQLIYIFQTCPCIIFQQQISGDMPSRETLVN